MNPRVLVLLSAVCFGTTGTAQALGPDGTEPSVVGAARVAVGGALLALLAWRRGGAPWPRVPVLLGAAGVAGYQLTFFAAVDATGVAVGTVVALGSGPVFAGLLARERVTVRWAAATGLAVAGVAVLVAAGTSAEIDPGGVALALGAGVSYATYTVAAKRLLAEHGPEAVMARLFGLGAIALAPVLVVEGLGEVGSAGGIALAVYLGAIPTALAYVLFARGLRHLPAGEVATLTLAEPVTATALGVDVLGERPGAVALLGVALVLAGLAVLAAPRRRAVPDPLPV
ncbi:MAG: drug/metabolite transporter, family [Solirubrobacteraceae bacterium]|nr:drug/metabolite transporter, family [Solirubrobacteraceae bacterium]